MDKYRIFCSCSLSIGIWHKMLYVMHQLMFLAKIACFLYLLISRMWFYSWASGMRTMIWIRYHRWRCKHVSIKSVHACMYVYSYVSSHPPFIETMSCILQQLFIVPAYIMFLRFNTTITLKKYANTVYLIPNKVTYVKGVDSQPASPRPPTPTPRPQPAPGRPPTSTYVIFFPLSTCTVKRIDPQQNGWVAF